MCYVKNDIVYVIESASSRIDDYYLRPLEFDAEASASSEWAKVESGTSLKVNIDFKARFRCASFFFFLNAIYFS